MALSRIEGCGNLYVGGLWVLRRSDTLLTKGITHVLSVVGFSPNDLKNFNGEPWSQYGRHFSHKVIDIDDVDDANLLAELPAAVDFINRGLSCDQHGGSGGGGGVYVHCAAGKSRSVSVVIAYLLWRYPQRFDPRVVGPSAYGSRAQSLPKQEDGGLRDASSVVEAALALVRQTRPMAEPNDGFMRQLALWWEMRCPSDVEVHPVYQRWAYRREVEQYVAVGQAPTRLRFEDEQQQPHRDGDMQEQKQQQQQQQQQGMVRLLCKKCRRLLAKTPFINKHVASPSSSRQPDGQVCPHYFIEPLSWMRPELERGELSGRFACPNIRCGATVGRYDWKGIRCACGDWVTPGLSLQRARVDEEVGTSVPRSMGIRMPPGFKGGGGGPGGGGSSVNL